MHEAAAPRDSWGEARKAIEALAMRPARRPRRERARDGRLRHGHRMPRHRVVDESGRHHQLENLSVHDASIFPTSLGANPQLSIYAIAARMAAALAGSLKA